MASEAVPYELRWNLFVRDELKNKKRNNPAISLFTDIRTNCLFQLLAHSGFDNRNVGLVPVMFRFIRTVFGNPDVGRLFIGKPGKFYPQLLQVEAGNFFIQFLG